MNKHSILHKKKTIFILSLYLLTFVIAENPNVHSKPTSEQTKTAHFSFIKGLLKVCIRKFLGFEMKRIL